MKCSEEIQAAVERVKHMEQLFDRLAAAPKTDAEAADILSEYLRSGRWQRDYELDEAGLLPKDLKRGVLSQDGLYDLLMNKK